MNYLKNYSIIILRVIVGTVFLWASLTKIVDPSKFAREISNYHVVPFGLENTIAIFLPWLEFFIGSSLILGIMVDGSIIICSTLLLMFNILVAQAMIRGFNIECGCGLKEGELVGYQKLFENFTFLGFCVLIYLREKKFLEIFPKTELSDK
jgi:putative oxidoreductase|tara:strand:- start:630 stop:1082 length:453 start_codon:yes stop_codon:yes gene_type:complete